jgi:hypothetical protein
MSLEKDLDPAQLRKLRPGTYLATPGRIDQVAETGSEAAGILTTAASLTFEDANVSPEEFLTVYEAIHQCLELSDEENPAQRVQQAVAEALQVTASLLDKPINEAIVAWISEWTAFVDSETALTAFMQHLSSVAQQYSLMVGLKHGA